MGRKPQDNPQLDMTPMIDVVFELIIFFVVTLTEAQKKDETIELEDGKHGIVLVPEELPPSHLQIDIGLYPSGPKKGKPRISMGDRDVTPSLPLEEHRSFPATLPWSPFYPPDLDRRVDSPALSGRGSRPSGRTSG